MEMRRNGIQENVILQVYISKNGRIIKITYDKDNSIEFIREAVKCVRKLEPIPPFYLDGKPIDSKIHIPITFRLIKNK
jgi:TonB family protein